jgi:hypothetical protein
MLGSRIGAPLVTWALLACGGGEPAPAEPAAAPAAPIKKEIPTSIDVASLTVKKAAGFVLPAPSETLALVRGSGRADKLNAMVNADALPEYSGKEAWKAALAVGVATADLLVLAPDATDAEVGRRIENLIAGLNAIQADPNDIARLEKLRGQVAGGAVSRDVMVAEFDEMRSVLLSDAGQRGSLPLVAVGGWARAVNLVARVSQESGQVPPGTDALKLEIVLRTLLEQVAKDPQAAAVAQPLERLLPIASGPLTTRETTSEDVGALRAATDEILAFAR